SSIRKAKCPVTFVVSRPMDKKPVMFTMPATADSTEAMRRLWESVRDFPLWRNIATIVLRIYDLVGGLMLRNVRLMRAEVIFAEVGSRCCQKDCVCPFMSNKLPCSRNVSTISFVVLC